MKSMKKALFFVWILGGSLAACKDKDLEQENINTVRIEVKDGTTVVGTFMWTDPDGAAGNAPRVDTIRLSANKTYSLETRFVDASVTPNNDFTQQIKDENTAHLLVYSVSVANLTVNNLNNDGSGKPFGQTANFVTAAVSTGSLRVVLKHNPDKSASNPGLTGESDVDVTFPVVIR